MFLVGWLGLGGMFGFSWGCCFVGGFFFGKVRDQTVMQKKPVFPLKYH